jgi:hypothetical protein
MERKKILLINQKANQKSQCHPERSAAKELTLSEAEWEGSGHKI